MAGHFDAIVVGLGAMGSAATYQLARRGLRVLGLDSHPLGHDQGSSHGDHRMIRRSAARPEIDAMSERAFTLWRTLEQESGADLLRITGEVMLLDSSTRPRAAVADDRRWRDPTLDGRRELLDATSLRDRFPGFQLHEGMIATYEAEAGFLRPEAGIAAHLAVATRHGATIRRPEEVLRWQCAGDSVTVTTSQGSYGADRLIITTGPWAAELLGDLGLPLQVVRIVNAYFAPTRPDWWRVERGAPNFLLSVPEGSYYGIPALADAGVKIGRHDAGEPTTARTIRREIDTSEIDSLRAVLDRYLPGASGPVTRQLTCMYTLTPDEQFIVERHPRYPQVAYGCGFSGTGYKFCGVIGEMLADLTLAGTTTLDSAFLSSTRFGARTTTR